MTIRTIIETMPLFREASPSTKAKMLNYAIVEKVEKGAYLFNVRDEIDRIYMIINGYVVLERINNQNHLRGIFLLSAGDLINEVIIDGHSSSISAKALSQLEVVSFSRNQLLEMMEQDFHFTKLYMDSMAKKIRKLYRQIANTTKMMTLESQIAAKLWKLGHDYGIKEQENIVIPFDLSITLLASLVGSNRESVSRVIKKMALANIVSITHKKCIIYQPEMLIQLEKKSSL